MVESTTATQIAFPGNGQVVSVTALPNTKYKITGIDLTKAKIDIVGSDIIISNADGSAKIVFLGLALFLFDEELAPELSFDDGLATPTALLAKVGEIGNLDIKEFIAISSVLPETNTEEKDQEEKNPQDTQEEDEEVRAAPKVSFGK